MVEYHRISAKDTYRLHQIVPKVLPDIFFGYVLYAGGIWRGDILVADIEELEEMDASEIESKKDSLQRKCERRNEVETSYSQSQMEQSKSVEEISVWEHSL